MMPSVRTSQLNLTQLSRNELKLSVARQSIQLPKSCACWISWWDADAADDEDDRFESVGAEEEEE